MKEEVIINKKSVNTNNKNTNNKNSNNKGNNTSIVLIVSILLSFICGMIGSYIVYNTVPVKESIVKNITTSELVETSIATSVDKVYNSTVVVVANSKGKQISTGTGFIYKKEKNKAYIMTNNHVVDGADSLMIEFNDKNDRVEVALVGKDVYSDVAVLTVAADKVPDPVSIGKSKSLKLGDTIFTVGAPMGVDYKGTVTKGIISGLDRLVEVSLSSSSASDYYMDVIQIDAAVNPGNSGGPLCDVSGNVVGLISLKIVQNEVEGMGFAIPIEDAMGYAEIIEKGGEVKRPYIGISMLDLTEEYYLWQNRITIPEGIEEGVAIVEVVKGSPADAAGLKTGDIITKLGGTSVGTISEFRYQLYRYKVGEKVEVIYYRDGKQKTTTIELGKSE